MRTLSEFDPLCRSATRGLHYGQERKLHKQAGYICADPKHSLQRFSLQSDGGPYIPTATTTTNYNYLWDTDSEGKVTPPAGGWTSSGNAEISFQLSGWWSTQGSGRVFDSS